MIDFIRKIDIAIKESDGLLTLILSIIQIIIDGGKNDEAQESDSGTETGTHKESEAGASSRDIKDI